MGKLVLVIDDDADQRRFLSRVLGARGYRVVAANDGEEGLAAIRAQRPDVILLDVMMPRLNGFQTCRRLKADPEHRTVPVVVLTAKDQPADEYWAREAGADEFMTKPVDAHALLELLDRMTGA
jgi:CheY-like chemotaxis protein